MNKDMRKMYSEKEIADLVQKAITGGNITFPIGSKIYQHGCTIKDTNDNEQTLIIYSNDKTSLKDKYVSNLTSPHNIISINALITGGYYVNIGTIKASGSPAGYKFEYIFEGALASFIIGDVTKFDSDSVTQI